MAAPPVRVRLGQFNIWQLSLEKIQSDEAEAVAQLEAASAILQRIRPDVLVLNEIDAHEDQPGGLEGATRAFLERHLSVGDEPLDYPFLFVAPSNTGRLSGLDLDGDGKIAQAADLGSREYGNDSYGYGEYPGQYSMALLSRFPIDRESARTFQTFRWRDLSGNHLPDGWYPEAILGQLRLSSKSHWDVPIEIEGHRLHLWVSHPTPPVFDGDEDRNGRRNFDEIGFWQRYLDGDESIYDDAGISGGYATDAPFVIVGDLNASPLDSETLFDGRNAISQLLEHERIQDTAATLVASRILDESSTGASDGLQATTGFGGGRRIDYLLPSRGIECVGGGVFWPDATTDPLGAEQAEAASDHRAIWLDVRLGS